MKRFIVQGWRYINVFQEMQSRALSLKDAAKKHSFNESHLHNVFQHYLKQKVLTRVENKDKADTYKLTKYGESLTTKAGKLLQEIEVGSDNYVETLRAEDTRQMQEQEQSDLQKAIEASKQGEQTEQGETGNVDNK